MKYDNDNWNAEWNQGPRDTWDWSSLYSIGTPHTFRFIGSNSDRIKWNKEYKEKYKYANGGHLFQEGGEGDILGLQVPLWAETVASFVPILGSAMDVKTAYENPTLGNIGTAALSVAGDLAGASLVRGLFKGVKAIDKFRKAEKAVKKLSKTAGKTEDYSRLLKAQEELNRAKEPFGGFTPDIVDYLAADLPKLGIVGTDFFNNTNQVIESYK